jgi:redox-sensitive bicupin YhaK (pirin superfamily)
MNTTEQPRKLTQTIPGMETSDGAGVKLRRSIGASQSLRLDPFLMLDEFGTENPDDYIAGFPSHPHRGFETVTYMIDGHMRHEDHLGNVGELKSGGVQWMTAGHGVIHSEMPQQESGRMRGFQLWLNLPAREKMKPANYKDIPASDLPEVDVTGGRLKLIAGQLEIDGEKLAGPINSQQDRMSTDPLFVDLDLRPGESFRLSVPRGHNAFAYAYQGVAHVSGQLLPHQHAGILGDGDYVDIQAGREGLRVIVLAGKPLGEPVVQYGPFVMNTRAEIEQALDDYRQGKLTA